MITKTNIELGDIILYKNSKLAHIITGSRTHHDRVNFNYITRLDNGLVHCPTVDPDGYSIPIIYESTEYSILHFMYNNKGYFLDYPKLKVVFKNGEYSIARS